MWRNWRSDGIGFKLKRIKDQLSTKMINYIPFGADKVSDFAILRCNHLMIIEHHIR